MINNYFPNTPGANVRQRHQRKEKPNHWSGYSSEQLSDDHSSTASADSFDAMEAFIDSEDDEASVVEASVVEASVVEENEQPLKSIEPTYTWLLLKSGFLGLLIAIGHAVIQLPQFETWPPQKYLFMIGLVILAILTLLRTVGVPTSTTSSGIISKSYISDTTTTSGGSREHSTTSGGYHTTTSGGEHTTTSSIRRYHTTSITSGRFHTTTNGGRYHYPTSGRVKSSRKAE